MVFGRTVLVLLHVIHVCLPHPIPTLVLWYVPFSCSYGTVSIGIELVYLLLLNLFLQLLSQCALRAFCFCSIFFRSLSHNALLGSYFLILVRSAKIRVRTSSGSSFGFILRICVSHQSYSSLSVRYVGSTLFWSMNTLYLRHI